MRAGTLRHRVTIQTLARTADDGGGYTEAWSNVATVWARVEPLSGGERWEAQQITANLSHRVAMRYRNDVTANNRLLFGARRLRIDAVIDVGERREQLEILCEEERI